MQNHVEHHDGPQPRGSRRSILIGIAALPAVVVALHLSGTVG